MSVGNLTCDLKVILLSYLNVIVFSLQDGTDAVVKEVLPGDSVHSLLSILDIITVSLMLLITLCLLLSLLNLSMRGKWSSYTNYIVTPPSLL